MIITAKFASVCRSCQRPINAGDRVSWSRGTPAVHAVCSDEGKARRVVMALRSKTEPVSTSLTPTLVTRWPLNLACP